MSRVIRDLNEWHSIASELKARGRSIGFVPTMGALHEGHLSLVARSRAENDVTVVSIFVNPTQFNQPEDLEKYPRTEAADAEALSGAGADFVIFPTFETIYPDRYRYRVSETELSRELCGAHRPGHFEGMLTVVLKLLNIARADRAYFGEKDFQQLQLVRGMAEAFFLPVQIVGVPTMREADGLAMSSRNLLLSPENRAKAPALQKVLLEAPNAAVAMERLGELGFVPEYVEDQLGRRLAAVRLGSVRLIDNVELRT